MKNPMTLGECRGFVEDVRKLAEDDEAAHGRRDDLWEEVLQQIAAGHPEPKELAEIALETEKIEFARWCA